jgi:glutathione S-transferase
MEPIVALKLYAHPFSSYCQKVLIALYENDIKFDYGLIAPDRPEAMAELEAHWPLRRFPVLADGNDAVIESSIIIEYLQLRHPGPVRLIPQDAQAALDVRFLDRFFDLYVHTPTQKIVGDSLREPARRDAQGVTEARQSLDTAYGWLERKLAGRAWAAGAEFTLADCAAAPALFYADWVHPIPEQHPQLRAYRQRLLQRPSFARAVDEARPYRPLFPLGAPDRD